MSYILADASAESHHFLDSPWVRVPKELGCAATASFLVSPLVSIIDKAIVQDITGVSSLLRSMGDASKQMVYQPKAFFGGLSFRLTFAVYFGTYAVANLSEAALDFADEKHETKRKVIKVSSASVTNIGLLAWRDSVFAREFASDKSKVPAKTPVRTFALFGARDFVTMGATFYAAPMLTNVLVRQYGWDRHQAEITSSLSLPVAAQFLTAPLHIHAIDYFNRPEASVNERFAQIKKEMGRVCFARGLRILPAFGIGSFSNNKFRELTIRQPNEDLLIQRRITLGIHELARRASLTKTTEPRPLATSDKRQ